MARKHHVQAAKRAAKEQRARRDEVKRRQRVAERRRTGLTMLAGIAVGAVLIASVVFVRWNPTRVGYVAGASAAAKKAGCTGVRNDGLAGKQALSTAVRYRGRPPSSGNYNPDPLPEQPAFIDRKATVPLLTERGVHSLARGFVVGWYDATLPAAEVATLRSAATGTTRFLAVPWRGGRLPGGRPFVLTSWQRTQRCRAVSAAVVNSFATTFGNAKRAPEEGGAGGSTLTPKPTASPTPRPSASLPR